MADPGPNASPRFRVAIRLTSITLGLLAASVWTAPATADAWTEVEAVVGESPVNGTTVQIRVGGALVGACMGDDGFKVDAKIDQAGVIVWVPTSTQSSKWAGYCM